jgi:hypothetical protein
MLASTLPSLVLSAAALIVSGTTAWLTLFRRGAVKMTRPRLVFFGWETTPSGPRPKIFLRCLLFSTGKRGRVIQNLYLRVKRGEYEGLFGSWAYGDRANLVPGSGLFIGPEGVVYNHHFLPQDNPDTPFVRFGFLPARYSVEIHADLLGRKRPTKLATISVILSEEACSRMYQDQVGVLFDWHPDQETYVAEIDTKPSPQALTPPPPLRPGL